jgi:hypothetical protein
MKNASNCLHFYKKLKFIDELVNLMNNEKEFRRVRRGNNYYEEPEYKIPDGLTIKIILLGLLAIFNKASYNQLLPWFKMFVPHRRARYIMASGMRALRIHGEVKMIERGTYKITERGWKKLRYYDLKIGLPEVIKSEIRDILEDIEMYPSRTLKIKRVRN